MNTRNSTLKIAAFLLISAWSSVVFANSLRTYGGSFNLPVPANPSSTKGWMNDAVINISEHFTVHDLDVNLSLKHTQVFDLQIYLQSPTGTAICLNMYNAYSDFFTGQNYLQTIFDDEAALPIELGTPPFTSRFRPKADYLLSAFDGEDSYGLWRLRIYDTFYANSGTLTDFKLMISVPEPASVIILMLAAGLMCLRRPRGNLKNV